MYSSFFAKRKIKKAIKRYRKEHPELEWLLWTFENNDMEYGIVGGFCLSILENRMPNDIDIIVNAEPLELKRIISAYYYTNDCNVSQNEYGGYKIKSGDLMMDVWTLKKHITHCYKIKNVPETIDIGLSSIMYTPKKLYDKYFIKSFKDKVVYIQDEANIDWNTVVRIIDYMANGYAISSKLAFRLKNSVDLEKAIQKYRKKANKTTNKKIDDFRKKYLSLTWTGDVEANTGSEASSR